MRALIFVLLLAGCSTGDGWNIWTGYGEQPSQPSAMQQFADACTRLGYTPDTDPWRDCLLKTRQFELDRRRAILEQYGREQPRSCYRDVLGSTCY